MKIFVQIVTLSTRKFILACLTPPQSLFSIFSIPGDNSAYLKHYCSVARSLFLGPFRCITKITFKTDFSQNVKISIFEGENFRQKGEFPCVKNFFAQWNSPFGRKFLPSKMEIFTFWGKLVLKVIFVVHLNVPKKSLLDTEK